jgi:hypothetical protein
MRGELGHGRAVLAAMLEKAMMRGLPSRASWKTFARFELYRSRPEQPFESG